MKRKVMVAMEFKCFGEFWDRNYRGESVFKSMQEDFQLIYSIYAELLNKNIKEINEKYSNLGPGFEKGFELGTPEEILYNHFVFAEMGQHIAEFNKILFSDHYKEYSEYCIYIGLNPDNLAFRMYVTPDSYVEVSYKELKSI